MAKKQKDKKPYYETISEQLIKQLEEGTAPWQKPWEPGNHMLPHNPVSGTKYKGANAIWLTMQGRSDPRWMTYKQAKSAGAQVLAGEKGTLIQFWKFRDRKVKRDEKGNPVLDKGGRKVMVTVEFDRPRVFSATVFNAEQIKGLPPLEKRKPAWDRHDRAEKILTNSGARIQHDQADRAFYRQSSDSIHMPGRPQFSTADKYYATALHELGHWTGHPDRMDRDLSGSFGSESYAKEELRAEIASLMVGDTLDIGHDPAQHAAYVKSWIKTLKEDPKEILRAARDAEKIKDRVMGYEKEKAQAVNKGQEKGDESRLGAPMESQVVEEAPQLGKNVSLPFELAKKFSERIENNQDRARFMKRVKNQLSESAVNPDIRINEPSASKEREGDFDR